MSEKLKGVVFDIQRYSIHDGPGIRTLVFMKGCPLRCKWCSNPEGLTSRKSIMFIAKFCYGCGVCVSACPNNAITKSENGEMIWDKQLCTDCLFCADACKITHARKVCGTEYTVPELLGIIEKDSIYFRRSKGGVTVGGGEPMMQAEFVSELLKESRSQLFINTAIETSSYAPWDKAKMLYENSNVIQTDIKHMDDEEHKKLTGVSNKLILSNIKGAAEMLDPSWQSLIIRIPVIPGMNDSEENIIATAKFVKLLKTVDHIELLPYHNLGEMKYDRVTHAGEYQLHGVAIPSDDYIQHLKQKVEECGVKAFVGGV